MISDNFTGSKIFLIDDTILNDLNNKLIVNEDIDQDNLNNFYTNYIESNQFAIIVIFLIFIYLYIKYIIKKDKEETENFKEITKYIDEKILKKKNKKNLNIKNTNINNNFINNNNLNENLIDDEYTIDDDDEDNDFSYSNETLYGQDEFISNNFLIEKENQYKNKNNLNTLTNIIFNEN